MGIYMNIKDLIFSLLFIILFIMITNKTEKMTDEITTKIRDIYKIDIDAIRNLSKLANDLTIEGNLVVPGNLVIKGGVTIDQGLNVDGGITVGQTLNTKGNLNVSGSVHGPSFTTVNTNILNNTNNIGTNTSKIGINTSKIGTNTSKIGTNANNIANKVSYNGVIRLQGKRANAHKSYIQMMDMVSLPFGPVLPVKDSVRSGNNSGNFTHHEFYVRTAGNHGY